LDQIIHDIGIDILKTRDARLSSWGPSYGLSTAPTLTPTSPPTATTPANPSTTAGSGATTATSTTTASGGTGPSTKNKATKTLPLSDPKSVRKKLKRFAPKGKSSSKVVDLLLEANQLKLEKTPICFCFLLRSMFEISVRDFCSANKLPFAKTKKGQAKDKSLAELLDDEGKRILSTTTDKVTISEIKTAISEIKNPHSVLSISTMNALVHSSTFTITPAHIIAGFHKIFPLLVELNK
jgi:hypothetical protein